MYVRFFGVLNRMEQHPVPQDVTGFQFKLIGDITLKQFGILAGGLILAYITLKIPLIPLILRWPIAVIIAIFGIGGAFVPIEDRPLDVWITNFIKRIYQPTQYVWQKNNAVPQLLQTPPQPMPVQPAPAPKPVAPPPQQPTPAPRIIMQTVPQPTESKPTMPKTISTPAPMTPTPIPTPPPVVKPLAPLPTINVPKTDGVLPSVSWEGDNPQSPAQTHKPTPKMAPAPTQKQPSSKWTIGNPSPFVRPQSFTGPTSAPVPITGNRIVFQEKPNSQTTVVTAPTDDKQVERIRTEYEQTTQKLNTQITQLQQELTQGSVARERLMELQQVLTQLAAEKEKLHNELVKLKQKLITSSQGNAVVPTEYSQAPQETRTTVKMVTPQSMVKVGMPSITSQPNIITGIIKDGSGTQLPNLIVTVKDKEGVPVRALKTNKIGQFAASTPLSNGVYFIEVEDPKNNYQFNRIEVSLEGQVLPPLEIFAVSQKDVVRQQLSRELFGQNAI